MFEYNIVEGMPIHVTEWKERGDRCIRVATGKIVWKLTFKCKKCGTLSEVCYCYSDKTAMIKDREEYKDNWICSLDCQVKDMTPEEQHAWILEQRRWFYKRYKGKPPFVKWWDINAVIEFMIDDFECEDEWCPEGADETCEIYS